MYIQPCTNPKSVKGATLNFSSQKTYDYSSYMAKKADDIVLISAIGGAAIALISAKNNMKREFLPKAFHNIGVATLGLFGLASLNFFAYEANHSKHRT